MADVAVAPRPVKRGHEDGLTYHLEIAAGEWAGR